MKTCSKCGIEKELTEFYENQGARCKVCILEYQKEYRKKNKEKIREIEREYYKKNKEKIREYHKKYRKEYRKKNKEKFRKRDRAAWLKCKYGITLEDYTKMLEDQNYCCKICGKHEDEERCNLAVDHCHTTGKVRGLLCLSCNTGLGKLQDSIELLDKAKEYLKCHEQQ